MTIDKHLKITMTRSQICDLMHACTACSIATAPHNDKWEALHDELLKLLSEYDEITAAGKVVITSKP